jgi:SAM-dependent methyltransferase
LIDTTTLLTTFRWTAQAAATAYVLNQVRKPGRWIGRPFLWLMNRSHSPMTDWGLRQVRIAKDFTILDVGCGGGRTLQKLATSAPDGRVYGLDYAAGSVAASKAQNRDLIAAGRVEVRRGSVSQLPYPENKFDLIISVESQYYWPDLVKDMQEINRVLKPGGTLLVLLESYSNKTKTKAAETALARKFPLYKRLNVAEQRRLFSEAGFSEIRISEEHAKGWLCATGQKPKTTIHS